MSNPHEIFELHARLITKTEQAVLLTNSEKEGARNIINKHREFWLPRSVIGTTQTIPVPGEYPVFRCQVPAWKIEQDKLWDFVKS